MTIYSAINISTNTNNKTAPTVLSLDYLMRNLQASVNLEKVSIFVKPENMEYCTHFSGIKDNNISAIISRDLSTSRSNFSVERTGVRSTKLYKEKNKQSKEACACHSCFSHCLNNSLETTILVSVVGC